MSKPDSTSTTLAITGMHCASCAQTIKRRLSKLDGVESCQVNYAAEKAEVVYHPSKVSVAEMNESVQKLGYVVTDLSPATNNSASVHDHAESISTSNKQRHLAHLAQLKQQVLIMLPMIIISLIMMVWEVGADYLLLWSPMNSVLKTFLHHLLPIFATYTLFVVGLPYVKSVFTFAKERVASMDTLVGIGTSIAFLYSFVLSSFENVLAPYLNTEFNYYDVTIVVIGFITLGKYLELRSKLKTSQAIEQLLNLQPQTALLIKDTIEHEVSVSQVIVGDVLKVKPGQKIPVDGVVIDGQSSVNEAMITGEAMPVKKSIDSQVIGGTLNKQGVLIMKATKVGEQTMLSQIISLVEKAQSSKAPIENLADKISAVFVPIVLVIAVLTLISWFLVGWSTQSFIELLPLAISSFVGVLVIACPCAMGLATPTAVIVGVGKAAQHGILIKNAESLQKASKVSYVVFDKTGTLTEGQPTVTQVIPVSQLSSEELLLLAAAVEQNSEHPLATAVMSAIKPGKQKVAAVTDFVAHEGLGAEAVIAKVRYMIGSPRYAAHSGLTVDQKTIDRLAAEGNTVLVLFTTQQILGYLAVADTLRDAAVETVNKLHLQGIKTALLTGDSMQTAKRIADKLHIDAVFAEVLPQQKAEYIQQLQKQGHVVAMVGDGINDAPALALADVGIALGTGTDVAIETASLTLLSGSISKVPDALLLAQKTFSTIKQNLFWAFFYNVISIPIAAGVLYPFIGILLSPAIAGGAMAFSSVSVLLNSLRLRSLKFQG